MHKLILGGFLAFFLISGCGQNNRPSSQKSIEQTSIIEGYPRLYEAVLNRDADQILTFTSDSTLAIRQQAWRALAQTPVDSLAPFIGKVKQSGDSITWFSLSMHELSSTELRGLEHYWLDHPNKRAGIDLVLGQQGDEQTLSFLLNHLDSPGQSDEQAFALALSRLVAQFSVDKKSQVETIHHAFSGDDPEITRAWLYGFYRGDKEDLNPSVKEILHTYWKTYGIGKSAAVDQYIAKILSPDAFAEVIEHYDSLHTLDNHVQLGVELAKNVPDFEWTERNKKAVKTLLKHPNVHVVQETLAGLSGRLSRKDSLSYFIKSQFINQEKTPPFVWLQALDLMAEQDSALVSSKASTLNRIAQDNPYLLPQVLQIRMNHKNSDAFLNKIETLLDDGSRLEALYAVNALGSFWANMKNNGDLKPRVRALTFKTLAMHDRSVTFATQSLFADQDLFKKSDFHKINRALISFKLPGDIEVYQAFGALYKNRFEEQARGLIDSLAALNYTPLNRSLKNAGWNVDVPENYKPEFRSPDWDHLWVLGRHPVWVLETEKGTIKIKMNTLSAPATVSAIDSLTRAGAYDGVPFHRVVPNFVIQGGDIELKNGFGGPDFIIPTEASEQGFVRGAAGIASAGPDTEGSQYFFMHQWSPHLNGRYTLFGNVTKGMDVVDRIVVGDVVTSAHWQK